MDQERFDRIKEIIDDAYDDFRNVEDMDDEPDLESLAEEIFYEFERLREGLAKTADGVVVTQGMTVFTGPEVDWLTSPERGCETEMRMVGGFEGEISAEECYSTEELAKKAKGKEEIIDIRSEILDIIFPKIKAQIIKTGKKHGIITCPNCEGDINYVNLIDDGFHLKGKCVNGCIEWTQ